MQAIGTTMNEWSKFYEDINELCKQRDNLRRIYDHYDEKMEKLIKARDEKAFRKMQETQSDITKFDRVKFIIYLFLYLLFQNDEKYRKATKDYLSISIYTYNRMNEFLDYSYSLVNPIVCKVINKIFMMILIT